MSGIFAGGFVVMLGWNKAEIGEVVKVTPKLFRVTRGNGWRAMQYPHNRALACFATREDAECLAQSLDGALGQRSERVNRARRDADVRIGEANEAYDKIQTRLIASALATAASGQDPQGLEAKPGKAAREAGNAQPLPPSKDSSNED